MPSPSTPRVSLRDIAQSLGISHATVSKALRDDPEISQARRKEVRDAAKAMGYRPDPLLQQLASYRRSKRTSRVESCIAWLNDWPDPLVYHGFPQYASYWKGAQQAAGRLGFRLEEFKTRLASPTTDGLRRMLLARGIRGVLIPPHHGDFRPSDMNWSGLCVVKIGFSVTELPTHVVSSDQYGGGRLAAEQLLKAGHTRIGFVSTRSLELRSRGNFSAAFLNTRDRMTAESDRIPPLFLESDNLASRDVFLRWLRRFRPTAVLYSPWAIAGWMNALDRKGDVQPVLCSISRLDAPADSGLNQFPEEVGQAAVEFLASQLTAHHSGIPDHPRCVLIEPRWEGRIPESPIRV